MNINSDKQFLIKLSILSITLSLYSSCSFSENQSEIKKSLNKLEKNKSKTEKKKETITENYSIGEEICELKIMDNQHKFKRSNNHFINDIHRLNKKIHLENNLSNIFTRPASYKNLNNEPLRKIKIAQDGSCLFNAVFGYKERIDHDEKAIRDRLKELLMSKFEDIKVCLKEEILSNMKFIDRAGHLQIIHNFFSKIESIEYSTHEITQLNIQGFSSILHEYIDKINLNPIAQNYTEQELIINDLNEELVSNFGELTIDELNFSDTFLAKFIEFICNPNSKMKNRYWGSDSIIKALTIAMNKHIIVHSRNIKNINQTTKFLNPNILTETDENSIHIEKIGQHFNILEKDEIIEIIDDDNLDSTLPCTVFSMNYGDYDLYRDISCDSEKYEESINSRDNEKNNQCDDDTDSMSKQTIREINEILNRLNPMQKNYLIQCSKKFIEITKKICCIHEKYIQINEVDSFFKDFKNEKNHNICDNSIILEEIEKSIIELENIYKPILSTYSLELSFLKKLLENLNLILILHKEYESYIKSQKSDTLKCNKKKSNNIFTTKLDMIEEINEEISMFCNINCTKKYIENIQDIENILIKIKFLLEMQLDRFFD